MTASPSNPSPSNPSPRATFDNQTFRHVLGHYPTGVCAITAVEETGAPIAMVVGSFTSVSLEPPLVAFLPAKTSTSWPRIERVGRFCVNVFAGDQAELCRRLSGKDPNKFADVSHRVSAAGSPVIDGVLAWIDCCCSAIHEAGDHWIVVARVVDLGVERVTDPLLFFLGQFAPPRGVATPGN